MEQIRTIILPAHKFALRYCTQYLKLLIKPCLFMVLGIIFLLLCFLNPVFAIFALFITIPSLCYGFWKGYCITYLLNFAAFGFLKNSDMALESYLNSFKAREKDFIKYISFCAILSLAFYIPVFYLFFKNVSKFDLSNPVSVITNSFFAFILFSIISIALIPFSNYLTQAYFFKKENENYFSLFINCYKNLDWIGIIIAVANIVITLIISSLNTFILPLLIILNLYFYSINMFWYYSRQDRQSNTVCITKNN